jgi:hypothetical protein
MLLTSFIALPGIISLNAGISVSISQQRGVWQQLAYKSSRGSGFFLVFDTCRNDVRLPLVGGSVLQTGLKPSSFKGLRRGVDPIFN